MASERPTGAATKNRSKQVQLTYGRFEDSEVLREREATVDDKGIRRIPYTKDDSTMMNNYVIGLKKKQGFTVEDKGEYLEFSMDNEKWKKDVEGEQHRLGNQRMSSARRTSSENLAPGMADVEISAAELEPISNTDIV
jgi:hypothetical protein